MKMKSQLSLQKYKKNENTYEQLYANRLDSLEKIDHKFLETYSPLKLNQEVDYLNKSMTTYKIKYIIKILLQTEVKMASQENSTKHRKNLY